MYTLCGLALAVALLAPAATPPQEPACGSFAATFEGTRIELAPLAGYVEVCGRSEPLCRYLTSGYAPTVQTLGYFVPEEDWERAQRTGQGFQRDMIAQLALDTKPSELPELKAYLKQGEGLSNPDEIAASLSATGRAELGILQESDDSVSFGVVVTHHTLPPLLPAEIRLVSSNSALVVRDRVLSLYVFRPYAAPADIAGVERDTLRWLDCIRRANAAPK